MIKQEPIANRDMRARSLYILGEQVDRAVTVCTRYQYNWGATTRLWEAAIKKIGRPLCLAAAEQIADNVHADDTVVISAGWVKRPYFENGEYDGYAGTAALARAVNIGLGARVLVVTDDACVDAFRKVLTAAEMRTWELDQFYRMPSYRSACVIGFPIDRKEALKAAVDTLDSLKPKVLVAVERSDENEKGVHHTGGGLDMSEWTAKVQYLFAEASARGLPTIGCFDIGNEIGGALVREAVREVIVPVGARCTCSCEGSIAGVTETTVSVVARSSNAAAYGIAACLAGILGRSEVLHDHQLQRRIMELMLEIPLADGPTLVSGFTEDGAPGELTLNLFDLLHWLVRGSIEGEGFAWERPPYVEGRGGLV